ncbi:MAG: aminotransferase class IV, partial [Arcobacter sp.]|nr:aminotransferase class IV [Arcobacter sp.]
RVERQSIEQLYLQKKLSDEIIIVQNNLITDTSIANIVIFYDNKWLTPKKPLLYGVTRERYLTNGIITEEAITTKMLRTATKLGLLNAMIDFDTISNFKIEE